MNLLHRSSMVGGGCGGGRALRRVESSPRPSLCRSDATKKKRSKRSRLSAALREFKVAAKERDKDGLLQILVTGHRTSRRGGTGDGAAGGTSTERSVADTGAEEREPVWHQGGGADAVALADGPLLELRRRPIATGGACGRDRRCSSWVLAVALVLTLACVVALGTAPAICCCTCVAWLCGGRGAQDHASDSDSACGRRRGSCRGRDTRATILPPFQNLTQLAAAGEAPVVAAVQQ